jgi:hypothetical protein
MTRLLARSLLLQLITLCTALGVLWAPVAEAAECSDEPEVASLIEQHDEPGGDDSSPEKHGACVHGHCHHASHAVGRTADDITSAAAETLIAGIAHSSLNSSATALATPPPRP